MIGERPHTKLDVWRVSMELCRDVYGVCRKLADEEKFGLASQMRRAAVSVPSNIAEGAARGTRREFSQFLKVAQGSLAELETQLELCAGYLALLEPTVVAPVLEKSNRVAKMITALKRSLKPEVASAPNDSRLTIRDSR